MPLTADDCSKALLGRGYFPKELPPPFQSSLLAAKLLEVRAKWNIAVANINARDRAKYPLPSHPVLFDMARKGHARRTLSIPNVINQFYLTEEISNHWIEITQLINASLFSITKCELSPSGRAIPMPPLSELAEKRIILYAAQGAILQTDVLSFYHSIYTHSIPWALHTKSVAKANRNTNDPTVFGNKIDFLLRSCQDGQTTGIPVGPDTSRVISELLLCAVENHIPNSLRSKASGFRYVDDFFLCFGSIGEADAVLAALREACLHFDLQLNAAKTHTGSALSYREQTWPSEISAMRIARFGNSQRRTLVRFFSTVIALANDLPDESIASFAVRKTARIFIQSANWPLYEAFLLRIARQNTNCIDSVVKIICTYAAVGHPISNTVGLFIERIIIDHAPYNHHFEVSWVLWLARSLNVHLSSVSSTLSTRVENDICALLALNLGRRRLLSGINRINSWLGSVTADDLLGDHWLLIYQSSLLKKPPSPTASSAVATNPFFSGLKAEGVSFYDLRATNRPVSIPGIEQQLDSALKGRKRGYLRGAILHHSRSSTETQDYEELGGDYDDDDSPFSDDDDDDLDGPI